MSVNRAASPGSKKVYSFLLVLSLILTGYGFGVSGVSIGSMIFAIYSLVSIVVMTMNATDSASGRHRYFLVPLLLSVFICVISLLSLLTLETGQYSSRNMMFNAVKVVVWAISISITNRLFLDYEVFYTWMIRISVIATLYLILQYIAWYGASLYLPNIFNLVIIRPYVEDYVNYAEYIKYAYTYFRPASFFAEPSFYGDLVLCTLSMILFDQRARSRTTKLCCVFLSIGVVLATSTSGIYLLIVVLIYYLLSNANKPIVLLVLPLIVAGIVLVVLFSAQTTVVDDLGVFGQTLQYTIRKPFNFTESLRIGRSYEYLTELAGINLLMGVGVGNENAYLGVIGVYMNSVTRLIYWCGYLGLLAFVAFLIAMAKNSSRDRCSFVLLAIYTAKLFVSDIAFSIYGILFLSVVIYRVKYSTSGCSGPTRPHVPARAVH